jgi:hypothetical protein
VASHEALVGVLIAAPGAFDQLRFVVWPGGPGVVVVQRSAPRQRS